MARKMGRNLKRAAAVLMASAAIALCAVSPAWGEERAGDIVNVTVPTRIDCALGADGTVTSPGGLEVVNNGPQDLYVGASTVDDFGQKVEFAIDLGGSPLLSRAGGKDVEGEVEFAGSSRKGLGLAVSKLNRTSHAALMDAAAQGEAPMFTVGFRFTFKALQGSMAISGEAKLGKTLTAVVTGQQADAKLAYRWYRDGQLIAATETSSYTTNDADLGKKLKCEAYDAAGRYVGAVSAEVGPIKGAEAFAVFSADDGSLNFYKRIDVPKAGEQFEGRTVTEVYTGFDTGVFVATNTPQNTWVDIETSTPWFDRRDEIISSKVVDPDISVEQLAFWYTRCTNITAVDLSKLDASRVTTVVGLFAHCHSMTACLLPKDLKNAIEFTDMFYQCKSITKVDLNCIGEGREARTLFGLMNGCSSLTSLTIPRQIADEMSYAFSGCNAMDNFAFVEDWDVSPSRGFLHTFAYSGKVKHLNLSKWKSTNAKTYEGMFAACASLESLDISGLSRLESVENLKMFYNCPKLSRVTLGDGFSWRGANNYLPIQSSDSIPGADGKWYAISDKKGYAPADIPSNKADTYVASPDMLPKETFAVFSEDDGSLNFYHRNIVPTTGSHFEGKTATRVYANFDDKVTHIDVYDHQYPVGPWYEVRDQIKSAKIVDKGIRPIYIDGWFAFLDNCTTISGLRQIDYSRCKSMRYLFLRNTQLTTIDLSGLSLPECQTFGGMFESCKALKEANLSNITLNSDNNLQLWFMFGMCDNVERIDLSGWNINQIEVSEYIFTECKKLREISLPGNFTWQKPDSYLPTPNASDIPGADGYWYDAATGDAYKPEEIPSNKAATYMAVNPIKAPTVTIEGEPIYGSSLTARVSGQPAGTTATSYQWQYYDNNLNAWYNSNLPGAKTNTLTLTKNPNGGSCEEFELRCVVNTTAGKKRVPQGISGAVGPVVKQQLTGSVRIDGEPIVGATLNAVPQGVQSDAKLAYQWYRTSEKSTLLSSGFTHSHGSNDSIVGPTINVTEKGELSFKVRAAFGDKPNTAAAFNVELRSAPSGKVMLTRSFSPSNYKDDNIKIQLDAGVYEFTTSYSSGIANYAPESTSSINIFVADIYFSSAITDKIAGATYPTYTVADSDLGTAISCHITDASGKYASGVASDPVGPVGPDTREAFAVYSADDGSLNFYKRSEVPRTGSQFEGKTATRVYTDIETMFVYNFMDIPWLNVMQEIRSANVVDSITPINTVFWFYEAKNLLRADLSRLDTSRMDAMDAMFYRCHSLETVDLGTWSASSVNSLIDMFMSCTSLKTVDVSHLDTRNVTHMNSMFGDCSSLVELDISNFDMSNVVEDTNMLYKLRSLKKLTIGAKCSLSPKSGLSVPSAESIPGADGKWYAASDGRGYATADIPSNKADTYYASKSLLPVVADESPDVVMPGVESVMDVANTEADSVVEVDAIDSEAVVLGEVENEEAERKPDEGVGAGSDGNEKQDESGSEIESAAGTPPEEEEPVPVTSEEAQ